MTTTTATTASTSAPRTRCVAMFVVVLALLASACGSSGGKLTASDAPSTTKPAAATAATTTAQAKATTSSLPDPCVLVGSADAIELAGTPLDAGEKAGTSDNLSCTYVGPPTGPTAQVEFFVGDGAKKFLDIDRELGHDFEPVPGVGDEAYLEEFSLFFRVGTRWNVIRLVRLDDFAAYEPRMVDLARRVAAKG